MNEVITFADILAIKIREKTSYCMGVVVISSGIRMEACALRGKEVVIKEAAMRRNRVCYRDGAVCTSCGRSNGVVDVE